MKPPTLSPSPGRRRLASALVLSVLAFLLLPGVLDLASSARAADEGRPATSPESDWSDAVLDDWAKTPVQQGGRAMPLFAWARYALLRINHKTTFKTPQDRRLGPLEWALDALFKPELARTYRCVRVENDEVLQAIGLEFKDRIKADRYAYDELEPGMARLELLAQRYRMKPEKERTLVEGGIVALDDAMSEYGALLHYLDWARSRVDVTGPAALAERFGGREAVPVSEALVPLAPGVREATDEMVKASERANPAKPMPYGIALQRTLRPFPALASMFEDSRLLSILPLTKQQVVQLKTLHDRREALSENPEAWLSPADLLARVVLWPNLDVAPAHLEMLGTLERLCASTSDPQAFAEGTRSFHETSKKLATDLGDYAGIESEVAYLRANLLGWAKHLFLLAILVVALSWLWPNKWLVRTAYGVTAVCALLVATGITWRCILRGRPPVTTLYETVIFVTGTMAVAGLVTEAITRQKIALALTPVLGWLGLVVAERYEVTNAKDTMPQLVAVLDTNFWLALHVSCIAIGYMASMFTGFVAHIYVLGKVFGFRKGRPEFYRTVARMVYGLLGFSLIFTTVGTILGGIWANESWGRFWGWDPKENGALMIVLWSLAMVHARLGGYVKAFGLSMAAVALNIVVAFSWWGVNNLGVGLHSYGFTAGIARTLNIFYLSEVAVLLLGGGWWLYQHFHLKRTLASGGGT